MSELSPAFPVSREIRGFKKPETRKELLLRLKEEIRNLFTVEGKDVRPTVAEYRAYRGLVTDRYYANPSQARESDHNIEHASTVWALSLGIQAYLTLGKSPTGKTCTYDRDSLGLAAFLHDSQRQGDIGESVFDLQGHGKRAAEYILQNSDALSKLVGHPLSKESLEKAQLACEYHDNEYRPPEEKTCDELVVLAAADRATLPRILFSYHTIVASLGKLAGIYQGIVWRRATRYEIKGNRDLVRTFLPIGTMLCLLAREKVGNNFDLMYQFNAVESAAKELGLFRE